MKFFQVIISAILVLIFFLPHSLAQQKVSKPKSTYEKFLSDVGTMFTKDFYEMASLPSEYQKLSAKVLKISSSKGSKYFLSLSAKAKYSDKSAIIVYEDLLEVDKALKILISKAKSEESKTFEYRERIFITNDGFKVGYYQRGTEQHFFIELGKYQSEDTFFFKSFKPLINTFSNAKAKIESLKK